MKTKFLTLIAALSVAVLLSSCGKVPQAEIDAANAAIEEVKTAGADVYVAEAFTALQDSMLAVNQSVEAQNGKLFKNYSKVTEQLAVVNQLTAEVKTKTEARKEEVKVEVAALQAEVAALVAQNNELVAQAPKGKEGTAALEAIKGDISVVEASIADVANQVAADQLLPALDKAKAAKEKAVALNTELNEVIAKYSKNRKK
ncbi:hypothetical protein [Maribellus sp. YY47]|uniref:hypothetical protein n=1 Tax=Maribellus sp. YY47 TaxID=2929486 RepID=UPI002000FDFB|nr:hypothetical protein [Maribellus sp. YY47]MCK3683322.1 hypothetical protein [Maribellus sp. YY47]